MTEPPSQTATVRETYDKLADDYDRRWKRYIDATLDATMARLDFRGHEAVLDLPTGTGQLVGRLLHRCPDLQITGVDLSPRMLARARSQPFAAHAAWINADVSHLPFPADTFDHILCVNSFHYFPDPRAALRELHRVLRPGGSLHLVDWCDDYLTCKLCSLWLRWTDPAFHQSYTLAHCRTLLEQTGFHITGAHRFRTLKIWGLMHLTAHPLL